MRIAGYGGAVLLGIACPGCILPKDIDVAATSSLARSLPSAPYSVAGGDVSSDIRIGTHDFELGADVGFVGRVDRTAPAAFSQVLGQLGYAYAPRPFEGRLGFELIGGAGGGARPGTSGTATGFILDGRASLLFRLTASNEVWNEDVSTSTEAFLVLGGQWLTLIRVGGDGEDHAPRNEYGGLLGVRFTFYDNGSP